MTNFCPVHQHSFIASCADCDADDYIPFEGPLWDSRGPRQVSEAEAAKLQETLHRIRQRQAERHLAAKERMAKRGWI
jgi:hypothetical protein